ncbi:hypothetical protein EHP00_1105 [Ecytonucleospora hepatopenaei]|uniref:C2H2-type domain-containing protein n=1 Tax=Ecytonucleospora hepatopenaei TaxID=646526 RepID=A0A1W0E356_9MICR|nr:hypothetical protein EHP00_1105 [Ecytonucleospora hepatopenaei]
MKIDFIANKNNESQLFEVQDYLLRENIGINLDLDIGNLQKTQARGSAFEVISMGQEKTNAIDFASSTFTELSTNSNRVYSMRSYTCDHEGCTKSFTSTHGLEYHKKHGHFEHKTFERRPYICQVAGCTKRYKNNNGLKYHIIHAHKDIDFDSSNK